MNHLLDQLESVLGGLEHLDLMICILSIFGIAFLIALILLIISHIRLRRLVDEIDLDSSEWQIGLLRHIANLYNACADSLFLGSTSSMTILSVMKAIERNFGLGDEHDDIYEQTEELLKKQIERAESFPKGKDIIPENMKEFFPELFEEEEK